MFLNLVIIFRTALAAVKTEFAKSSLILISVWYCCSLCSLQLHHFQKILTVCIFFVLFARRMIFLPQKGLHSFIALSVFIQANCTKRLWKLGPGRVLSTVKLNPHKNKIQGFNTIMLSQIRPQTHWHKRIRTEINCIVVELLWPQRVVFNKALHLYHFHFYPCMRVWEWNVILKHAFKVTIFQEVQDSKQVLDSNASSHYSARCWILFSLNKSSWSVEQELIIVDWQLGTVPLLLQQDSFGNQHCSNAASLISEHFNDLLPDE